MRERIGWFRLLERLGEGGMGVVYSAQDERLGRRVAIKTIRGDADHEARGRFWREARAAARVNHPNVCQIHEVGEADGDLYIAMELLQGEPLSSRLGRGPLELDETGRVALGVLAALEALHQEQILHRDLKPSNVFLTPHGVKLLDFGLARPAVDDSLAHTATLTRAGMVLGTPRYMSPEQWRGDAVDARSDLFALGVLLFEMLTGNPAFTGRTPAEARHAVLFDQPPALSGSTAVAAVDDVIRRALAKRMEERFESAAVMADALREALRRSDGASVSRVRAVTRVIVLPFRMLRPDADIDFLSFSLPDAIASSLSGFESIVVRSTLAASKFDTASPDFDRIAHEAQVDLVLTGTLLRSGDQLRVNAQLVEAPAGTVLWSQAIQTSWGDIFALQDKLARLIVESLSLPLSGAQRGSLQSDVPANAKAYEFFLRANQLALDASTWTLARDLYLQCLDADPRYAPAWAQLGRVYRLLAKYVARGAEENLLRACARTSRSSPGGAWTR
jgi:serine/threonine protein kinase